jgi:hypothetical protein
MNFLLQRKPVFLFLCACALAMPAHAQTSIDPRSDAKVHVGPLYLTPTLAVEEFGIDTNVFNNNQEQRDFTFTLAPHVDLWVPFARRALITTSVATDLVYYQTYSSERSFNPEVRVRGDLFLNRLTLFAEPRYLRTRQRLNYEIDARAEREEQSARAGASLKISPKLSVETGWSIAQLAFNADETFNSVSLQETLNRETRTGAATVRYNATPYTAVAVRADRSTDRFEFSPDRDSDSFRLMPGVEFNPRALVSGTGYVGLRRFTPKSSAMQPFSGLVANATLGYTLLGSTRFLFTADRDVTYSYERTQPYYVVDGYGITIRRQLIGRTDVTGGVQRHKYTYRDLLLPGATPSDVGRVDLTLTWLATFGYRFGQSTRLGFGAFYRERHSNSSRFLDYEGFRFASTVDYGF